MGRVTPSSAKMNNKNLRLIGENPKIGIRPTITDGRLGGVRESLERQTMDMAKSVAKLLAEKLRHADGTKVQCVLADGTIGGVAEAALCAEKFAREGVGVSLTVTPCWCYGSETMDTNPHTPKAVWGFNGTERPGAVYLAAVSAVHNQKGLPVFNIYGRDVQDGGDKNIPADVQEKLLCFARAGLAAATMRGKSYLSIGGTSMGIGGSIVDQSFFEAYLGMRVEAVDMVELVRRIERGIFDPKEFARALKWTRENCREGLDPNPEKSRRSQAEKDEQWELSVKMAIITRDLMIGNPRLKELGFGEESLGRNAIASGFQGQRQWTDHMPNGDFLEAILCSSFDWNGIRQPFMVATENDCLNGATMLFGHLLTGTAQVFADVRTYWSPDAVEARHRPQAYRRGGRWIFAPHQFRPGGARRHWPAGKRWPAGDETILGNHAGRSGEMFAGRRMVQFCPRVFPRRRLVNAFSHARRNARHGGAYQHRQGPWTGVANRRRLDG